MDSITINPTQLMEFLIKYGLYFAPCIITGVIKKPLNIPKRWVPLFPFLIAYLVVGCQIIEAGSLGTWMQITAKIIKEGSILAVASIGARELWTKFFKRKE